MGAVRAGLATLLDGKQWRMAGVLEYAFFTEMIHRQPRMARIFHGCVAACCLIIGVFNAGAQFNPLGPHGVIPRALNVLISLGCLIAGLWWLRPSWPSRRCALCFLAWADISSVVNVWAISSPEARFGIACIISFAGMYASFALGWRVVAVHCTFAFVYIVGLVWMTVAIDGRPLWALMPFVTVPLTVVVALPSVVQFAVETARREAQKVTAESTRDPLTGVLNRRGWQYAAQQLIAAAPLPGVVAVAVVDIDKFKQVNDGAGHAFGDVVLRETAQRLAADNDVVQVARVGGDEFVVAAHLGAADQVEGFAKRCTEDVFLDLTVPVAASVGVTYVDAGGDMPPASDLEQVADRAMYAAKRAGGAGYVVIDYAAARA